MNMVLGIINKQNVKLFALVAGGLALFSLIFIPLQQWTFVIDWFLQTPIVIIIGQSVFFLTAIVLLTSFIIIIRELV